MNRDQIAGDSVCLVDRALPRRAVLRAAVGLSGAALLATGPGRAAASQDTTPAASAFPDLSRVAPLPLTGERLATFEAYIATKLAEIGVPGAAVAVVQGAEVTFLQGFGVRELGQSAPVNADTMLRIGSVTKSFSSLLAATLVDVGRLTWETPIVDLLPDFAVADPELTPRLTIADAFCACTGLPRRDWQLVLSSRMLTPELVMEGAATLPLTAPYGEQFQYNNQMVAAGGYAAGVADGGSPDALNRAYTNALRARVLDPIGMTHSTLDLGEVLATGDYSVPHGAGISGAIQPMLLQEDDAWILAVEPTGGLWSTAREMARYVQTELQHGVSPDGRRVVSEENLDRTWQPGVALPAAAPGVPAALATFGEHYALGWFTGDYFGQRIVWHNGATLGFHSLVTMLPDAHLGAVVLTNATVSVAGDLTRAVQMRLLELVFDLPATIDAALAPGPAAIEAAREQLLAQLGPVDTAAVAPFLGRYNNPVVGDLTLALPERKLIATIGSLSSELQPRLDADGVLIDYLFIDPPLGSFPPEFSVTFTQDAGGQPQPVITVLTAPGEATEIYHFEPIGEA